jgi:glycosyltransferase involved in cell wall biosynthesis
MNHTGVGRHVDNFFAGLVRQRPSGVRVHYLDPSRAHQVQRALVDLRENDATIFLWRLAPQLLPPFRGRRILWPYFEADRLAPKWIAEFLAYDEIWSPTDWGAQVLRDHGVPSERVRVVPAGVNDAVFRPRPQSRAGFTFLSVGKYENRKSIDEIVAAFREEFARDAYPETRLLLKADYPLYPQRIHELRGRVADDARIGVVSGDFSDQQMAALYNSADAFVFPSKSEGFGLPCIEALACAVPVVATRCSGQATILDRVAGLFRPVDYTLAPLVDEDYARFYAADYGDCNFGSWAIPSPVSLRQAMRDVYEAPLAWRARAAEASQIVRRAFSWDAVAAAALARLREPSSMA